MRPRRASSLSDYRGLAGGTNRLVLAEFLWVDASLKKKRENFLLREVNHKNASVGVKAVATSALSGKGNGGGLIMSCTPLQIISKHRQRAVCFSCDLDVIRNWTKSA